MREPDPDRWLAGLEDDAANGENDSDPGDEYDDTGDYEDYLDNVNEDGAEDR